MPHPFELLCYQKLFGYFGTWNLYHFCRDSRSSSSLLNYCTVLHPQKLHIYNALLRALAGILIVRYLGVLILKGECQSKSQKGCLPASPFDNRADDFMSDPA